MFNESPGLLPSQNARTVFINQTAAAVYAEPSVDSPEVGRLAQGARLHISPSGSDDVKGWLHISTDTDVQGYIKTVTKALSSEEARAELDRLNSAVRMGLAKIALGLALVAVGVIATVISSSASSGFTIWYGAVLVGLGNIGWGIEQLAFTRRAIKEFNELFSEALMGGAGTS